MFRGVTTQGSRAIQSKGQVRELCSCPQRKEKIMDIGKGFREGDPSFVRRELERVREPREDSAGLAQSTNPKLQSEGINLLNMIEVRMKNLLQSLNAIESLTNNLNKNLLPMESHGESSKVEAKKPQGWLENHIENLELLIGRAGQIHYQVERLTQATKTNKVGQ